jgi:hypothetical protein
LVGSAPDTGGAPPWPRCAGVTAARY